MTCPICQRATDAKYRPFCSHRCSEVDLGRWLTGAYALPATEIERDDESSDAQSAPKEPRPN